VTLRAAPVAVALAVVTAAAGGCGDRGSSAGRLPAVALPALAAGAAPLHLGRLGGPAVVNLWATWCAPCRRDLPDLQQASEDWPDVRFVGIDIGEDPARARAFLAGLGVTFEQFADVDGDFSDGLGVASLPVTVVLDDGGAIAERHIGSMSREQLDAALAGL
jgi:thiol-disulfide isomerase/thioredoxin